MLRAMEVTRVRLGGQQPLDASVGCHVAAVRAHFAGPQVTGWPHTRHVSPSGVSGGWSMASAPGDLSTSQRKT